MSNPAMVAGRPYDPRNPDVIQARELKSDFIVYYCGGNSGRWKLERVADGAVMAEGQLEAMLSLLTIYPNSRRSTWAEDFGKIDWASRQRQYAEEDARVFAVFEAIDWTARAKACAEFEEKMFAEMDGKWNGSL